jgi:hypothetical protein
MSEGKALIVAGRRRLAAVPLPLLLGMVLLLLLLLLLVSVRREGPAAVGAGGGREGGRASLSSCGSSGVSATVMTGGGMVSCGRTERKEGRDRIV